jgi:DNA-binding winged helix-turn-helix (wHTH) protein/tetratricopeptide (TPR) repeat protein
MRKLGNGKKLETRSGRRLHSRESQEQPVAISFGEFHIDCARRRLTRSGRRIQIQRKPLDVLIYLAARPHRVVNREELLEEFWTLSVNEEVLTRCVSVVRKLLDDVREPPRFIETVWGVGYRFIGPAAVRWKGESSKAVRPVPWPRTVQPAPKGRGFGKWALAGALLAALAAGWLWRSGAGTTDPGAERMAVLPMTAELADDQWLAEALTDHLAQAVSGIEGLTVIAAGSAARYSARSDPTEIGRELNVGTVLASQLGREEDATVLRAQLVSAVDGSVLWNYAARPEEGVLEAVQIDRLASSVARRLWANLRTRDRPSAVNPTAYQHYLRGRYLWNRRSGTGLAAAIDSYEAALSVDPDYSEAFVGLADAWLLLPLYGAAPPGEAVPQARAAAEKALQLDAQTPRALAVLGVIAMQYDWDWTEAEALLRQALTLNPNDATTEQWLGELYCYQLRTEDCRRHLQAAVGLSPLSPVLRMMQGSPYLFSGNFAQAVAAYSQALEGDPDFPLTHYVLGLARAGMGEWEGAIASYRRAMPELGLAIVGGPLSFALARSGQGVNARELVDELEALVQTEYVPPTKLAIAWLGMSDRRRAMEWLDRAVEARDDRLVYLAVDAHFRELHGDPDFRSLAQRVGLADVLPLP